MYLAQTNLEVDTTKEFEFTQSNSSKILVYKTKSGVINPEIHKLYINPEQKGIVSVFDYAEYGRNCHMLGLTNEVKMRLRAL